MAGRRRSLLVLLLLTVTAVTMSTTVACAAPPRPVEATSTGALQPLTKILVFSKTTGFRHSSIPTGIATIRQLAQANGVTVTATEDAGQFTTENLAQYQAVVWLSTTGDVLNPGQQAAFQSYLEDGGGYVGVHAAADTEYDWPRYGSLVGVWFADHPPIQPAKVRREDPANPATAPIDGPWSVTDEWYNFRTNPRATVRVLQSLDETSYAGGTMGDHPITWCHDNAGGRAFYTGLGHTEQLWADADFRRLIWGGIQVAARSVAADCRPAGGAPTPAVALSARVNNRLVAAESGGAAPLIANRTGFGPWESFGVRFVAPGQIVLRANANGRLVCADAAGGAALIANRNAAGSWETFDVVHNADGTISLRAHANGRYVTAENGGAASLIANRTAIGLWEKFSFVDA